MTRYKNVDGELVPFTPQEEAQFDQEEQEYLAEQAYLQSPEHAEDMVQKTAEEILTSDAKFKALALATVDLVMADLSGLSRAQVVSAYRDRIIHHLRE